MERSAGPISRPILTDMRASFLIFIFAALPLNGQELFASFGQHGAPGPGSVTVTDVSAQQASIAYTASSGSACTIQVSTSISLTPLVLDVDPGTFLNSNQDLSRPSTITNGLTRGVLIGQRSPQYATNGTYSGIRHFSRSLAPLTTYYGQIGGAGCGTATFSFATTNIPLGQVYGDPWLFDPANPGDQPWPEAIGGTAAEGFNDPLTGVYKIGR